MKFWLKLESENYDLKSAENIYKRLMQLKQTCRNSF